MPIPEESRDDASRSGASAILGGAPARAPDGFDDEHRARHRREQRFRRIPDDTRHESLARDGSDHEQIDAMGNSEAGDLDARVALREVNVPVRNLLAKRSEAR